MPGLEGDSEAHEGVGEAPEEEKTKASPWFDVKYSGEMEFEELLETMQRLHRHRKRRPWMQALARELASKHTACEGDPPRSHVGWAPVSDDDSPEAVHQEEATRQPPLSKPWVSKRQPGVDSKGMNGLFRMFKEKGDLNNVDKDGKWEFMPYPLVVDSGAAETVIPSSLFPNHKLHESEG